MIFRTLFNVVKWYRESKKEITDPEYAKHLSQFCRDSGIFDLPVDVAQELVAELISKEIWSPEIPTTNLTNDHDFVRNLNIPACLSDCFLKYGELSHYISSYVIGPNLVIPSAKPNWRIVGSSEEGSSVLIQANEDSIFLDGTRE